MPAKAPHQPARVILYLEGTGRHSHGQKVDDFVWSHIHQKHIHAGKEYADPKELLTAFQNAMKRSSKHYTILPLLLPCSWPNLEKARQAKKEGCAHDCQPTPGSASPDPSGHTA